MSLPKIWARIHADYLARDRYAYYDDLIQRASVAGFQIIALAELRQQILTNHNRQGGKIFVHRHDIDTDVSGAREFFEIEKRNRVRATYFFRLSTLDIPLMRDIHAYGSEVGYHYEEIATVAKRLGLTTREAVKAHMTDIRTEFERNFRQVERDLGFKLRSAASHGDFANRRLDYFNVEILKDQDLRARIGLEYEAYDPELASSFDSYISDSTADRSFKGGDPIQAIADCSCICLLSHPRHWRTSGIDNTKDNVIRGLEEIRWRIAARPSNARMIGHQ
jgi:hypothetical protein